MSIIITKRGDAPVRVERSLIEQEDYLQRTVYENPESIPLHELKDGIRLLVLAREFPTGSGPIDALGIDADGDVYIIETKLYKNADKRRVVAQMLDYGASLWSTYSESTAFSREVERVLQKSQRTSLTETLTAFYDLADDDEAEGILDAVERNVSEGRFRFVVLMDRLDDRLRDMIRFVNQNSRFDILGVELDFYQHNDFEIIIPNLFGAEVRKEVDSTPARSSRRWDAERFFAVAENELEPDVVRALRTLYDWSIANADVIDWGTGKHSGSFNTKLASLHPTRSFIGAYTTGEIALNFKWLTGEDVPAATREAITRLANDLQTHTSIPLPSDLTDSYYRLQAPEWVPHVSELLDQCEKLLES